MKTPNNFFFKILAIALIPAAFLACSKKPISGSGNSTTTTTTTPPPVTLVKTDVKEWLTTPDQSQLLARQNISLLFGTTTNSNATINVDTTTTYQTIDGFGFALTGGSAYVINGLPANVSNALIKELFSADSASIGISYIRITIGASDMSASTFTYDDGGVDVNLNNFSIATEQTDLIPVLKKVIANNPNIKILACPWTAPVWMKTGTIGNGGFEGGSLNPAYYDAYARYFVKYIQAMAAQGIVINAVTCQNEPLNAYNTPAMLMQATEEAAFIKNNLGPAFASAGITAKIIAYDHNCDHPEYATSILGDAAANVFVDGSAFHLYGGDISAMSTVHTAFPSKNLYFTEQATFSNGTFSGDLSWHVNNLIVGATRNWSRNVLEWVLATDPSFGPHTTGGCGTCQGAVTVSSQTFTRNVSYYIIAHASKFVKPGAMRIASDASTSLPNVAFKNADGSKVLIVLNNSGSTQVFNIKFNSKIVTSTLNSGAVATYTW
jgi:glucosylceramidase